MKKILWVVTALLVCFIVVPAAAVQGQASDEFPDPCEPGANYYKPGNLLQNCGFKNGLDNWQTFQISGKPQFATASGKDSHVIFSPAARITTNGQFVGGIMQQVPAEPGAEYYANVTVIIWDNSGTTDGAVSRKVGIDPTGGTDPNSSSIVWGPLVDQGFKNCPGEVVCAQLQTKAYAQSDKITYFIWIDNHSNATFFCIDDTGLLKTGNVQPPPTPTSPPPTATATELPATATATETPVPPTDTPLPATETPTSTSTSTATPTNTPTATVTPTQTPEPESTSAAVSAQNDDQHSSADGGDLTSGLALFAGVGVGFVVLAIAAVAAGVGILYRLGLKEDKSGEENDDQGDEETP